MTAQELLDLFDKAIKLLEEDNKKREKEYQEWLRKRQIRISLQD